MTPELIAALVTALGVGAILQEFVRAAIGRWTGRSQRERDENRSRVHAARELAFDIDQERALRRAWEDFGQRLYHLAIQYVPRELQADLIPTKPAPPAPLASKE